MEEYQFMVLAKKFAHHDTSDHDQTDCLICEGILAVLGGQYELRAIAEATGFDDDQEGYRGDQ